ncbi:hypothetical protein ACET3Z_013841 [Daucus carota]
MLTWLSEPPLAPPASSTSLTSKVEKSASVRKTTAASCPLPLSNQSMSVSTISPSFKSSDPPVANLKTILAEHPNQTVVKD